MKFNARYWLLFSLLNLLIVAALGVLLRYKIGFDFPYFDQRNIHHAHSHLAFTGWLTHTIFVLILSFIFSHTESPYLKQYNYLLAANLVCAYGMLVSYFIQGYGIVSTTFTILTIVVVAVFMRYSFLDFKKIAGMQPAVAWFKAALCFNLISSAGTFMVIYMMLIGPFQERTYLASEYFYLHFQYNGFFIFACLGFAVSELQRLLPLYTYDKNVFRMFAIALVPAYFLSTLWANLPMWLYVMVVLAALLQMVAWIKLLNDIKRSWNTHANISSAVKYLFIIVGFAFTIKLMLQLGSTIPIVSKLAFGFRNIVIAYLHLVLLAVVSGFLLTYLYATKMLSNTRNALLALTVFLAGVFLNELVLAIQGIASFSYIVISYASEILLGVTLLMFTGALLLVLTQYLKSGD